MLASGLIALVAALLLPDRARLDHRITYDVQLRRARPLPALRQSATRADGDFR